MIIYEFIKNDFGNKFKPFCLSTEKGYFNFYTLSEVKQFLKENGLSKEEIKKVVGK